MDPPAIVSFLGFPGWGAVHLQLAARADPAGMALRLGQALEAADPAQGAVGLLTAFLRLQGDAQPLGRPWGALPAGGQRFSHRWRIVCRGRERPPRVAAWCWQGSARGWRSCGRPLPLTQFLARHGPVLGRAGRDAGWNPTCNRIGPDLRLSPESPPP